MDGIIDNLTNAINTWNAKLAEIWLLLTQSPQEFRGGGIWKVITQIHGALVAIALALVVLFFVVGVLKTTTSWAVTLLGGVFITILSFILILTVYGRFFKLYMYTAISPVPLSTWAGEGTQNISMTFMKSYMGVCMEGVIIVLACIIFSSFAAAPPSIDSSASAVSMVWSYIGELVFNMLILVGTVKMSDRVVKDMMGL